MCMVASMLCQTSSCVELMSLGQTHELLSVSQFNVIVVS